VQRLRIRYAKRGRLRFTSHRDFSRAFERAVARARVPVAYSSGFNPHPRISYAGAAPTGSASEAEYLELAMAEQVDPDRLRAALDEALPDGLDLLAVVVAGPGSLADRLEGSRWRLTLPGVSEERAQAAVEALLAAVEVRVQRMTKADQSCAILEVVLRHGTPSVRPDDVLAGLREVAGLQADAAVLYERLAQGPLDAEDGTLGDPLAPDRDAV